MSYEEVSSEELDLRFDQFQQDLEKFKLGKSEFINEHAVRHVLTERLNIALELNRRCWKAFAGESPLENEGVDNEYFEQLIKLDQEVFYQLIDTPIHFFKLLTLLNFEIDGSAAKIKYTMLGEIEKFHQVMLIVHHIHRHNKKREQEKTPAQKRSKPAGKLPNREN